MLSPQPVPRAAPAESDGKMSAKVFVGNLDFNTTKTEVQTLFSQIGEIRDVFLPMDRESGRLLLGNFRLLLLLVEEAQEVVDRRVAGAERLEVPTRLDRREDRRRVVLRVVDGEGLLELR